MRPDAVEAAFRQIQSVARPSRDNSHLPQLFALRQMRDPALAPLYELLMTVEDWQMQVHGVLGLAAIAPSPSSSCLYETVSSV